MTFSIIRWRRWRIGTGRVLALAVAVAALAVPTAQAAQEHYQPFSPTAKAFVAPTALAYGDFYQPFSPTAMAFDSFAAPLSQTRESYYEPFSPTEKAPEIWRQSPDLTPSAPTPIVEPDGFGWSDAGIGAAVGIAGGILLVGAALVALRRRDRVALS